MVVWYVWTVNVVSNLKLFLEFEVLYAEDMTVAYKKKFFSAFYFCYFHYMVVGPHLFSHPSPFLKAC